MNFTVERCTVLMVAGVALLWGLAGNVQAHCDAENGPVAVAAREALNTRDFTPIQIWVGQEQEKELRDRFDQCVEVRQAGGQARDLADRYFVETAVRLHREAEGMSYTGLKPARPLPPDIQKAETALETGNVETINDFLCEAVRSETQKWFRKARQAQKERNESVSAGRDYVDAYVKYVIFVHGLYQKIQAGPAHGVGE